MIKNERQYRITRAQARKFAHALHELRQRRAEPDGVHPLLRKAQEDSLHSQLTDFEAELKEYESLRSGSREFEELAMFDALPDSLVKARIAKGLSQKQLAERLGLKEQQIQRYEASGYDSASLGRVRDVIRALEGTSA